MKLFVIGNGFDIAHGLETSYGSFRDYLDEEDWEFLSKLEEMYGIRFPDFINDVKEKIWKESVKKYLWQDFEKNLSSIDETRIIECGECIDLGLESGDIGVEDTLNEYWENQYGFIKRLNEFIKLWSKQVNTDTPRKTNRISEDTNDLFITFNYTLLLEEVYNVDKYNILHIHGSIDENNDSPPVIGHGDYSKITEMKRISKESGEKFYEKKCSIYNAAANYLERTFKDVNYYIAIHIDFFSRLSDVDKIFVIGHSLGDVDIPYFKKIKENTKQDAIWNIYYHHDGDNIKFMNKIVSIGVKRGNIKMLKSEEFFLVRF
ncbi:hypothetical protein DVW07_05270 [Clostridium botulinum]|uniref:bacteriophage abortive infection AbiH family protein n=1 Tax=Clostridium botulinum TaxID=1491 RepID=UPI0019675135|nr:bacteriophage abortive infection AbiH family protein [Clostridium botulinum]MBN1041473.1 hypothetical protein [Clostridium botulinum]